MKKSLLWLVVALCLGQGVEAQSRTLAEKQQILDAVGNPFNTGSVQSFDERYEGVKGSPFLLEDWKSGEVYMMNGKAYHNLLIKYDVYLDEVVVKRIDSAEVIPAKEEIHSFRLVTGPNQPERRFVRLDYLNNYRKFPYNHFVEVLYEGKSTLLATHSKNMIRANYRGGYHANRPYDMFSEPMSRYYWIANDGRVRVLKPQQKSVLRALSAKKNEVRDYIQSNAVDVSHAGGLVKVVQFYDQQP